MDYRMNCSTFCFNQFAGIWSVLGDMCLFTRCNYDD